jgi:hypothetical protein
MYGINRLMTMFPSGLNIEQDSAWGVWIIMLIWMVGYISRGLCKRFYFDEENKVKTLLICVRD